MRYVAPLLLWLFLGKAHAQVHIDSVLNWKPPHVILKFAPLTLLELQNTLEAGIEVRVAPMMSIQGQFGYGPGWLLWQNLPSRYQERENWRGRFEVRWYLDRYIGARQFPFGPYLAVDLLYKQLNAREATTLGRDCVGGNCGYFQKINDPIQRRIWGVAVKVGRQAAIGYRANTQQPRWLLDSYIGLGLRQGRTIRYRSVDGLDFSSGDAPFSINPFESRETIMPNVVAGVKLGYVIY